MRNFALVLGLGFTTQLTCVLAFAETIEIHVSTQGNDSSFGSLDQPVQTLHRAAELVRESRNRMPERAVNVIVQAGEYTFSQPLLLNEQDSGTVDAPIVYKAADEHQVILSGAVKPVRVGMAADSLEYRSRLKPKALTKVVEFEAPVGSESWTISARGEAHSLQPSSLLLFANGKCFQQSHFPNQGWLRAGANSALEAALVRIDAKAETWIHGFPNNDYQDEFLPLSRVTPTAWRAEARFRITNSLEDLDQPGEWYLDASNQRILWWPDGTDEVHLRVSSLETLISIYDAESVQFEGFTIEGVRVQAVEIAGGYSCGIHNCEVRCAGNVGINLFHGKEHTIANCEIHSTGSSAIRIEGGNREGRVPAAHVCRGNRIHHCGTQNLARHAAIAAFGVGLTIEDNSVSQQPDWAISVWGDDNLVQTNHIHHVCLETSDTGAVYLSDNSGYQGNVINQNHIHDVGGHDRRNAFGVYLDNRSSRNVVSANRIHHTPRALVVRGGSENKLSENVIHNCWIGVQFQWSVDSQGNLLSSNVIDSENALLVSESNPGALSAEKNTTSTADSFVHTRAEGL